MGFRGFNKGFVLVTMLLFLLVLSLLAFNILEAGLLENKMIMFYQDNVRSFYLAEKKLLQIEQRFDKEISQVEKIDTDVCGVRFYRLTVRVNDVCLQSVVADADDAGDCKRETDIVLGRQSFSIKGCDDLAIPAKSLSSSVPA